MPLSSIADGDGVYDALTGGAETNSGVKVTHTKALGLSAIWRGVNLIAGDLGRHHFGIYSAKPGLGEAKTPDPFHPAARLMRKPNDYMTPFTFRQTLQAHALLYGNGYAYIQRSELDASPLALLPLDPARTWPVRVNGELWYVTQTDGPIRGRRRKNPGAWVKIPASDMLHIKGLGFDGLVGYPVLKILRETIGGAIAARDYGARYFKNDASPGIVIQVPAGMQDKAIENLRRTWGALHKGFRNAHEIAILRDGVTLANYSKASARDAQMLESRAFDAREIANVLGVPPHKVGDPS
ncbi:MAG TPA: phage portal protein, partial [Gemmata sp.]